jgi:hypothetical protein
MFAEHAKGPNRNQELLLQPVVVAVVQASKLSDKVHLLSNKFVETVTVADKSFAILACNELLLNLF